MICMIQLYWVIQNYGVSQGCSWPAQDFEAKKEIMLVVIVVHHYVRVPGSALEFQGKNEEGKREGV